jgi:hypothetical protein
MLQLIYKHKWLTSFCINLFLFLLFNLFLFPIFNSGDDVFLMYTVSGGFGEPPTNLLHYNHIWHPALGWLVKTMFINFPAVNWYSVFLMTLNGFSCTVILSILFKKFEFKTALVLYFIFFFFIEMRMLLSLNFTAAAGVAAVAGHMLLLENVKTKKNKPDLVAVIFLLLAGLLRLHVTAAISLFFFPCFLFYALKEYKKWGVTLTIVWGMLLLLNAQHQNFYKKNINGWQEQENYRQSMFSFINQTSNFPALAGENVMTPVEQSFISSAFFLDTSVLTSRKFSELSKIGKGKKTFEINEFSRGMYWLYIDLRAYILLLLIGLYGSWRANILKPLLRKWLPFLFFAGGLYFVLLLFYKMTPALYLCFMMMGWVYLVFVLSGLRSDSNHKWTLKNYSMFFLLLPFTWMTIRIFKNNNLNKEKHRRFECFITEINRYPANLFIATDDFLPLGSYYIWDPPSQNKLSNFIYKDRAITFMYGQTLKRYGIAELMTSVYKNPNIFLVGRELPALKNYYYEKHKVCIEISPQLKEFKCMKARRVLVCQ